MPKEIFPSSFECDCGHQSDFFENTVLVFLRRRETLNVSYATTGVSPPYEAS
jgi:hypothetical protein